MLPRCLAVLLLASVAVRDVTFAAKLRLSLPERLDVTEGVSLTINCSFSPPPTDPNHVIVKWSVLPAFYSKNTPIGDVIQIYNSGVDVVGVGVAALVGDVVKGDCSVRLRRISAGLGPVIGCMVVCGRCNTEDVAVAREATLNVTVAAPRRRGGDAASHPTATAPLPSSTKRTWLLMVVVVAMVTALGFVAGAAAVVAVLVYNRADERGSAPILVPECLLMSDAVSAECFANGVKVQTSGGHPDSAQCHKTTETSLGSPGASVTKTSFFS
ncbi:uncharacterized protein LOC142917868 isoform X2 [Petromyzon marinus]|uniref:uncharacterized protein LOC142917868 isoform X2 n=1 Tax=Petromyzon marinus TaxID=7757 RepID=UPI003F6F563D